MKKIELNIVALANSGSQSNNFAVILEEKGSSRRLPIIIGVFEAQAIAVALENVKPPRPLTHDLIKSSIELLGLNLKEVIISDLKDGIFYGTLILEKEDGEIIRLDSRTSDAMALAVRFGCPIYTYDFMLDSSGMIIETPEESDHKKSKRKRLQDFSLEELNRKLEVALEEENYEKAAKLRDEISRRKSGS